eukprot:2860191-Pleurochrysis_carterae.AAC.1
MEIGARSLRWREGIPIARMHRSDRLPDAASCTDSMVNRRGLDFVTTEHCATRRTSAEHLV